MFPVLLLPASVIVLAKLKGVDSGTVNVLYELVLVLYVHVEPSLAIYKLTSSAFKASLLVAGDYFHQK